jgi:hypothetical protein
MNSLARKRLQLVAVAAVFLAPMLIAFGLHYAGWQPTSTRNNGTLIRPPQDIAADPAKLPDGAAYSWKDAQYRWTLVIVAGPGCAAACEARIAEADKVWSLMTQKATRLRLAAVGTDATPALREKYPRVEFVRSDAAPLAALRPTAPDSAVAAVVDPAGLLMLRFDAGYDPAHVREDLSRLIR